MSQAYDGGCAAQQKALYAAVGSRHTIKLLIVLSHWPHVATQVEQQVAELVARHVFQWNRSHWTLVEQQVADTFSC